MLTNNSKFSSLSFLKMKHDTHDEFFKLQNTIRMNNVNSFPTNFEKLARAHIQSNTDQINQIKLCQNNDLHRRKNECAKKRFILAETNPPHSARLLKFQCILASAQSLRRRGKQRRCFHCWGDNAKSTGNDIMGFETFFVFQIIIVFLNFEFKFWNFSDFGWIWRVLVFLRKMCERRKSIKKITTRRVNFCITQTHL